jgi:hypothetical protein
MRAHLRTLFVLAAVAGIAATSQSGAAPKDEIRSTFIRFVNAQNAHDLKGIEGLLADTPDFLWIAPGHVVRKRDAALERFRELFKGTWRVDPDWTTFQVLGLDVSTMEVFVRVRASEGAPARNAQMNVIVVNTARGWRVQNIFVSGA